MLKNSSQFLKEKIEKIELIDSKIKSNDPTLTSEAIIRK